MLEDMNYNELFFSSPRLCSKAQINLFYMFNTVSDKTYLLLFLPGQGFSTLTAEETGGGSEVLLDMSAPMFRTK